MTADGGEVVHWGPQPFAAVVSELCAAFGCAPDVALRQDLVLCREIIDFRNAREALRLVNGGRHGAEALQQRPGLMELLVEMHRAQGGNMDSGQLIASMGAEAVVAVGALADGTVGDDGG